MRISVTADAHLTTKTEHSERYNALENIFEQTVAEGIEDLIIAGDLFDKDFQNYSEFEQLCKKHRKLQLHVIPGNHDPGISGKSIAGDNIHIYTDPTALEIDSTTFLFIPYEEKAGMGERIAEMEKEIPCLRHDGRKHRAEGCHNGSPLFNRHGRANRLPYPGRRLPALRLAPREGRWEISLEAWNYAD